MIVIEGRAWLAGDDLDTDQILHGRYLSVTDPQELAIHCCEDIRPDLRERVEPGDILLAGENLGCGSSREHAVLSLRALGISCIVAKSFARIFFRNCINLGLPALECPAAVAEAEDGDRFRVVLQEGKVINRTKRRSYEAAPIPGFLARILAAGGLENYVRQLLAESGSPQRR